MKVAGYTKVQTCTCHNEFQDTTYGKGKRVHNQMNKNWDKVRKRAVTVRCTSCGTVNENKRGDIFSA